MPTKYTVTHKVRPGRSGSSIYLAAPTEDRAGQHGRVDWDSGGHAEYSRFPEETTWYRDTLVSRSGIPVEVASFGSRATVKEQASDEVAAQLDSMVMSGATVEWVD